MNKWWKNILLGKAADLDIPRKIHVICFDNGVEEEKSRLLAYMYTKTIDKNTDVHYFDDPDRVDVEAIKIMLGKNINTFNVIDTSGSGRVVESLDIIDGAAQAVKEADIFLRNTVGLENRCKSELESRLRLYQDSDFRKKMINLYETVVIPNLNVYDEARVATSFRKWVDKKAREELDLIKSTRTYDDGAAG